MSTYSDPMDRLQLYSLTTAITVSCVSPAGGAAGGGVAVLGGGVRGGAELAAQAGGRGGGPARVAAAVGRGGPPLLLHPPQPGPSTLPGSQGHGRLLPNLMEM